MLPGLEVGVVRGPRHALSARMDVGERQTRAGRREPPCQRDRIAAPSLTVDSDKHVQGHESSLAHCVLEATTDRFSGHPWGPPYALRLITEERTPSMGLRLAMRR